MFGREVGYFLMAHSLAAAATATFRFRLTDLVVQIWYGGDVGNTTALNSSVFSLIWMLLFVVSQPF